MPPRKLRDPIDAFLTANSRRVLAPRRAPVPLHEPESETRKIIAEKRKRMKRLLREAMEELLGDCRNKTTLLARILGVRTQHISTALNSNAPQRTVMINIVRALLLHITGIREHLSDVENKLRLTLEIMEDRRVFAYKQLPPVDFESVTAQDNRHRRRDHVMGIIQAEHQRRSRVGPEQP